MEDINVYKNVVIYEIDMEAVLSKIPEKVILAQITLQYQR